MAPCQGVRGGRAGCRSKNATRYSVVPAELSGVPFNTEPATQRDPDEAATNAFSQPGETMTSASVKAIFKPRA